MKRVLVARVVVAASGCAALVAIASAQPAPADQPAPAAAPPPAAEESGSGSSGSGAPVPANPYVEAPAEPPAAPPAKPRPKDPSVDMPEVLTTPTGWLLPAAVLYSRTALDTGGGVSSDNRVGLGDVAEFGVATSDRVRARSLMTDKAEPIEPYITATFRMGVAEDRLFDGQPGLVLGFVKSFERSHDNFKTRIAELTLVASKKLGPRAAVHLGGAFWDASLQGQGVDTSLHDRTVHTIGDQIRAFGGIEVRPLDKSEILIDLGWSPEFCYQCTGG
ncbi:MAG TPA: hypothetical protein VLT45_31960, partial [Kofleriaceae bacterium]|nr:hypothetical protein [Kofleriaceae bacterium]